MHTSIFISCKSAHYQPAQALSNWRKLVLNILTLLERKATSQLSYLITLYFVLFYSKGSPSFT